MGNPEAELAGCDRDAVGGDAVAGHPEVHPLQTMGRC